MLRIRPAVVAVLVATVLALTACSSGRPPPDAAPATDTPAPSPSLPAGPAPAAAFRTMVDPEGDMTTADVELAAHLGEAVCQQARATGDSDALAARWRADADRAAAGELAGLDVVLVIGLALPAARALCTDQREVIEGALVSLGLPREAVDSVEAARGRGP